MLAFNPISLNPFQYKTYVTRCSVLPRCTPDIYAKDDVPGEVCFCVVFTMALCSLGSKQTLIRLLFDIIQLK